MKFSTSICAAIVPAVVMAQFNNVTSSSAPTSITGVTSSGTHNSTTFITGVTSSGSHNGTTFITGVTSSGSHNGTTTMTGATSSGGYNSTSYVTTTEVVTELTTYCPYPTTFTTNGHTFTVTEPTTLTITDCPCTLTTVVPKPTETSSASSSHTVEPAPNAGNNMVVPSILGVAGIAWMML